MVVIEKKIWPNMFENDRYLPVDFRCADFDLQEGDVITFREWNPKTEKYTGRYYSRTTKRVTKHESPTGYWTQEELEEHGIYIIEFE